MSDLTAALGPPSITPRQVAAAVAGNALEFYDFTLYAFFAVQIGHAFFPVKSPYISLMLSLATFGVGFVLRPVGAIYLGRLADRRGRRPAMLLSFAMMGVAILGLSLTPGYARIGLAAPALVLLWRLCQGFALGGEVGPTTAYLVEAAPRDKRAFYGAWQAGSQNLANIVAGLVGAGLALALGEATMAAWGWRAAFLVGAAVLPFGLIIRRNLPETLHEHAREEARHLGRTTLMASLPILLMGFGLVAATTVPTYVFNFMTTFAMTTLHMSAGKSLLATLASGACGLTGGLIGGVLADRLGRRPLMIWPRVASVVITWPAFWLMVRNHDLPTLLGATAVMTFVGALSTAATLTAITESLGPKLRGVGMGGVYALAVALFGGTTQNVLVWLKHVTGDPLSPGWYTTAFTVVGVISAFLMRESAPSRSR